MNHTSMWCSCYFFHTVMPGAFGVLSFKDCELSSHLKAKGSYSAEVWIQQVQDYVSNTTHCMQHASTSNQVSFQKNPYTYTYIGVPVLVHTGQQYKGNQLDVQDTVSFSLCSYLIALSRPIASSSASLQPRIRCQETAKESRICWHMALLSVDNEKKKSVPSLVLTRFLDRSEVLLWFVSLKSKQVYCFTYGWLMPAWWQD